MDFSKRNRNVALSRWKKILKKEREEIDNTPKGILNKIILCGFLAGDGCVESRITGKTKHYEVRFFPDDELMLKTYLTAMRKVYKKEPTVTKKGKLFYARLTSRTVVEDLQKLANFGLHRWDIPPIFANKSCKLAWLKAFFSAEAYIGSRTIKIQTVNFAGMQNVAKLLEECNIHHSQYSYHPKKINHSDVCIIVIAKKEERMKFYQKIGLWHERKEQTLKNSLSL